MLSSNRHKIKVLFSKLCQTLTDKERAVELQSSLLLFLLGAWILVVHFISTVPRAFYVLETARGENLLGIVFVCVSLVQFAVLMTDDMPLRRAMQLFNVGLWCFLLSVIFSKDWRRPGVPIYFLFTLTAIRSYFYLRQK